MKLRYIITTVLLIAVMVLGLILIIKNIDDSMQSLPKEDVEVEGYVLLIRAKQNVPVVANIVNKLYSSTSSNDIKDLFSEYKFSKDLQSKLNKQFKGVEYEEIERVEIYETGYQLNIQKEEIRYNMELNFHEGNENKGNYNVFITLDKNDNVIYLQGY